MEYFWSTQNTLKTEKVSEVLINLDAIRHPLAQRCSILSTKGGGFHSNPSEVTPSLDSGVASALMEWKPALTPALSRWYQTPLHLPKPLASPYLNLHLAFFYFFFPPKCVPFFPHFLVSVCDSDVCVSLWPRGSGRVGIVFQKGPLHLYLPGFSSTAWGAQTTQPPAGAPAQKARPTRTPLQLHCNYYSPSSYSAACCTV